MGCVPERLHLFLREESCRDRHGEAAIVAVLEGGVEVYAAITEIKARTKGVHLSQIETNVEKFQQKNVGMLPKFVSKKHVYLT